MECVPRDIFALLETSPHQSVHPRAHTLTLLMTVESDGFVTVSSTSTTTPSSNQLNSVGLGFPGATQEKEAAPPTTPYTPTGGVVTSEGGEGLGDG